LKYISYLKKPIKFKIVKTISFIALISSFFIILSNGISYADVSIGGSYNCDSNAVIYCGASSASALVTKYTNGDGLNSASSIQNIFNYFGINSSQINSMPQTAVLGYVTRSGNVFINNQLVATNAITGGRDFIPGSTAQTFNGTTFFIRPPTVSFLTTPLPAYVVMNNNQFQFAILSSCGNPIKATPIPPPPVPTPPVAPPIVTPTPPSTPSRTTILPNTGANYLVTIAIFFISTISGYLVFKFYLNHKTSLDIN
jgi:hypothetical protein